MSASFTGMSSTVQRSERLLFVVQDSQRRPEASQGLVSLLRILGFFLSGDLRARQWRLQLALRTLGIELRRPVAFERKGCLNENPEQLESETGLKLVHCSVHSIRRDRRARIIKQCCSSQWPLRVTAYSDSSVCSNPF
jgi:hypothetical protein